MIVHLVVDGNPAPQGSKRAFAVTRKDGSPVLGKSGRPLINTVEQNKARVDPWRGDVMDAARRLIAAELPGTFPLRGPLLVAMTFTFNRPKGHYGTGRNRLVLKPSAPAYPDEGEPGDASKLLRSTEDALQAVGLIANDKQIVDFCRAAKLYALEPIVSPKAGTWRQGSLPPANVAALPGVDAMPHPGAVIRIQTLAAQSSEVGPVHPLDLTESMEAPQLWPAATPTE